MRGLPYIEPQVPAPLWVRDLVTQKVYLSREIDKLDCCIRLHRVVVKEDDFDYPLILKQSAAMRAYRGCLTQRIKIWRDNEQA